MTLSEIMRLASVNPEAVASVQTPAALWQMLRALEQRVASAEAEADEAKLQARLATEAAEASEVVARAEKLAAAATERRAAAAVQDVAAQLRRQYDRDRSAAQRSTAQLRRAAEAARLSCARQHEREEAAKADTLGASTPGSSTPTRVSRFRTSGPGWARTVLGGKQRPALSAGQPLASWPVGRPLPTLGAAPGSMASSGTGGACSGQLRPNVTSAGGAVKGKVRETPAWALSRCRCN